MKTMRVAGLATLVGVLAVVAVGAAIRSGAISPGAMCGSSDKATTAQASQSPDPFMAVMCERACAAKQEYREDQVVSQPGAEVGDLTRCPVSGVVFAVQEDNPGHMHDGQTWLTCCETCVGKLRKNPERFVKS